MFIFNRNRGLFQPRLCPHLLSIPFEFPRSQAIPRSHPQDHFWVTFGSPVCQISRVSLFDISQPLLHSKTCYSLSNLFNALPKTSPLRFSVYQTLLQVATSKDNLSVLELTKSDVQNWLSEWEITDEDKSVFLKSIVDAYVQAEEPYVCNFILWNEIVIF